MDWTLLLQALGLVMVIEGLWPFVSPQGWRAAFTRLLDLPQRQIRLGALATILGGLLLLWVAR